MHPALSIIVFTTASGLGYGLAAALGLGVLPPEALATKIAHLLALGLIGSGLMSSTLHLGNPQRAWRAFSQWRSSWLSREGVLAVVTFLPLLCTAWASVFDNAYLVIPGILGTGLSLVTVYCTSMIYASLKSVDAWHTPLTPTCYLLFSAAGGALSAAFFAVAAGRTNPLMLIAAILFLAAAWTAKLVWRRRALSLVPLSSAESATGLGFIGTVRPFEPPHRTGNYLTREMGFRIARKHAEKLFLIAIGLGGIVPALICLVLLAGGAGGVLAGLLLFVAVLGNVAGVLVERWLFFAEARHAVMTYYEGDSIAA